MARGFESKDVEFQQAERERSKESRPEVTREQRVADDRRVTIALSLARMRADLGKAKASAHRSMIEQAIATLEAELASLT